jgi:hypothetical protein
MTVASRKGVLVRHMACRITTGFRAIATLALRGPVLSAIARAQPFNRWPPGFRQKIAFAASNRHLLVNPSPRFDTRPFRLISPDAYRLGVSPSQARAGGTSEPRRLIEGSDHRHGGDRPDARRGHQQADGRMLLGKGPDPAVERSHAGEDVPARLHQCPEDRHEVRSDRQLAFDDLLRPAPEPADRPGPNMIPNVFSSPRISFSSRTRIPTRASRAVSIARLT